MTDVTVDTCDNNHKFLKFENHPMKDGKARCPYCMSTGLDNEREIVKTQADMMQNLLDQLEERPDVTSAVTKAMIRVEKLLCEKLGKDWAPSGMSVVTLVDELAAKQYACKGIPRKGCDYLAACDGVCNKCGEIHHHHQMVWNHYHPEKHKWVDLTNDERLEILERVPQLTVRGLYAVEDKLKEKNT